MPLEYPCCSICNERYVVDIKVARVLPCGDSFCEDCLVKDSNLNKCHECKSQNTVTMKECPIVRAIMKAAKPVDDSFVFCEDTFNKFADISSSKESLCQKMKEYKTFINKHTLLRTVSDIKIDNATEKLRRCETYYMDLIQLETNIKLNIEAEAFDDKLNKIKEQIYKQTIQQQVLEESISKLKNDARVYFSYNGKNKAVLTYDVDGVHLPNDWSYKLEMEESDFEIKLDSVWFKPYSKASVAYIRLGPIRDYSRKVYFQVDGSHRYGEMFLEGCFRKHELKVLLTQGDGYYGIFKLKKTSDMYNDPCDITVENLIKGDLYTEDNEDNTIGYYVCMKEGIKRRRIGTLLDGLSYLEQDIEGATTVMTGIVMFKLK